MNDKQKLCLIIGVFSVVVFIATSSIYASRNVLSGFSFFQYTFGTLSNPQTYTNWLGIIGLGVTAGSVAGFFLFKDKK